MWRWTSDTNRRPPSPGRSRANSACRRHSTAASSPLTACPPASTARAQAVPCLPCCGSSLGAPAADGHRSFRHDCRGLDLDLRFIFDECDHLDHGHGRDVFPHHVAIGAPDLSQSGQIFLLVSDEPGQPRNVLWRPAGLPHDCNDVLQRLADLGNEVLAFEFLLCIPPDLTRDKNDPAFSRNTIRITLRTFPMARVQELMGRLRCGHWLASDDCAPRRSLKRWIFPVAVLGSASRNFTDRGYLYGAIVALT